MFSVSSDAKTIKGEKKGYLTAILYLSPYTNSGYQVCPKASEGCAASCLYTAGRGVFTNVQNARINKTIRFFTDRNGFMEDIVHDIERLIKKAIRENFIPVIRMNGTSDIAWEKIACIRNGIKYKSVMEAFPDIQFYDYTKILGRKTALALPNYALTFSLSENNDEEAKIAIKQGYNVSVVMKLRRKENKPKKWDIYKCINGDDNDLRFLDPKGVIVGLHAKGKARYDTSGFVRPAVGGFR
jgi:hypothetical protein